MAKIQHSFDIKKDKKKKVAPIEQKPVIKLAEARKKIDRWMKPIREK